MKLEDQVVSLELAKKLKELGVKQESVFYWSYHDDGNSMKKPGLAYVDDCNLSFMEDLVAAFTVAELGEMLPVRLPRSKWLLEIRPMPDGLNATTGWQIGYLSDNDTINHRHWEVTEADARAAMLVYLIENKLISVSN